ncbi:response regulator transcription factor [Salipaludibacillus sp. HK11]|uniref:response regulator transcription factor n=1 Tax=Salipaludibacillus sp. HK11 TaxID=3394320 RepID=UPI0039FC9089
MIDTELCRVVIVDDETLIRQGIKHYFDWEEEGFLIVGEASNGQEALDLVESVTPHIIITDIVMPIMDGEELTKIVKEKYQNIEVLILSSYGEFDYVRSSFQSGVVDYILKPKLEADTLLKALKTAASRVTGLNMKEKHGNVDMSVDRIIDKLISGFEVNFDKEEMRQFLPYSNYFLLGIDINNLKSEQSLPILNEIKEKFELASQNNQFQTVFHFFKSHQNTLFFLINRNSNELDNIVVYISKVIKANVSYVLSDVFTDFSHLEKVYNESLSKLIKCRFYYPERTVMIHEQMLKAPAKLVHFNLERFTEELKRERFEAAFSYLDKHVQLITEIRSMDIFEYKSFFNNIIFTITILLRNMDYNVKDLEKKKYSYMTSIDEASTAKEVVYQLDQFVDESRHCIFKQQSEAENPNMKMLIEYISDHYMEPMSLSEIAKHFHFNPSYLSSYFAAHNKEGFIEYLNKIRIEEAIKLLRSSSSSISEISGMVGYSDHSYFCKVFKKIIGLSPSQYRRKQYK